MKNKDFKQTIKILSRKDLIELLILYKKERDELIEENKALKTAGLFLYGVVSNLID